MFSKHKLGHDESLLHKPNLLKYFSSEAIVRRVYSSKYKASQFNVFVEIISFMWIYSHSLFYSSTVINLVLFILTSAKSSYFTGSSLGHFKQFLIKCQTWSS